MSINKNIKVLTCLLGLYPLQFFASCEALYHDMKQTWVARSGDVEIQYQQVIDNYIKLYQENYRPESFFEKLERNIAQLELQSVSPSIKARARSSLTMFFHYDDSIKSTLMELVELNYTPSFYCLGFVHERGIGTPVNHVEAWAWFMTAFAADGINAKEHLTRVWKLLNTQDEIKAKQIADQYTRQYTDILNTPSVTILQ